MRRRLGGREKRELKTQKIVSNRVGTHLKALNKVCTTAARAILPVFRTTPIHALLRESGLNPAEISLNSIAKKAAIRIRRLDHRHPLSQRVEKLTSTQHLTRFARNAASIPSSEKIDPLIYPPWDIGELRNSSIFPTDQASTSNLLRTRFFQEYLNSLPKNDIQVYSDGSKLPNGNLGAGFVIFQHGRLVCSGASPLGSSIEVEDAEVRAALQGIKAAIALPTTRFSKDLWVFIDNRNVANKILSKTPVFSSQSTYSETIEITKLWKTRERLPHISEGEINIRWVPSHSGIHGNHLADIEAKKGASMHYNGPLELSFSSLQNWQKTKMDSSRENWWQAESPCLYKDLEIGSAPSLPKET